MKTRIFLIVLSSGLLISCSSSQNNSLFGDYKQSSCTGVNCSGQNSNPEPSFERFDNSDVVLGKLDNTLELSGNCRLKDVTNSEIKIRVTSSTAGETTLTDSYTPITGISSDTARSAKCEKGRWSIALNACTAYLGYAGAHVIELTLRGIDKNNRYVEIQDGTITFNVIRSAQCISSIF